MITLLDEAFRCLYPLYRQWISQKSSYNGYPPESTNDQVVRSQRAKKDGRALPKVPKTGNNNVIILLAVTVTHCRFNLALRHLPPYNQP